MVPSLDVRTPEWWRRNQSMKSNGTGASGRGGRLRPSLLIALLVVALAAGVVLWLRSVGPPPPDSQMLYDQARLAMHKGDLALAEQRLAECLEIDPDHVMARLYFGQVLRDAGKTDAAIEMWQSVQNGTDSQVAMARYLEGGVAIERGRVDDSRDLLAESVRLNPTSLEAREKLVLVYRMLRRPEALAALLDEIAALRPLTVEELILRTVPRDAGYPPDETVHVLRQTLASDPHDAESQMALASALRELGDLDALQQLVETVASTGDVTDKLQAVQVEALLDAGHVAKAAALCEGLDRAEEGSLELWQACGWYALETKDFDRAASLLAKVHRRQPYDRDVCYRLGQALERLGHREPARELIERSVRLDDVQRLCLRLTRGDITDAAQLLPPYLEIAGLLEDLGRPREAFDWYVQAARLAPKDLEIQAGLERARLASTTRPTAKPISLPALTEVSPETRGAGATGQTPADVTPAEPSVSGSIAFVDVHREVGIDWTYFNGETGYEYLIESMGGGVIVLDYDADGWPDLYFPQGCRWPHDPESNVHRDRLYRNLAGRSFRDVTDAAGLGSNRYGMGGAAADFDNDGFDDLVVANYGRNQFYRNNGDGTFTEVEFGFPTDDEEMSTSAVAVDVNSDGLLDLYVANYIQDMKPCRRADGGYALCDPEVFEGQPDRLWLNAGDGTFRDISSSAGIDLPNGKGLGVVAADFDEDGRIDIYVANDGVPNFLLHNESDDEAVRFGERGLLSGTALDHEGRSQAGMGIAVADFNGDERSDLYVTNFYLEHNTLYLNEGDMIFVDATRRVDLYHPTLPLLGFGTLGRDLDGDGWPDLAVANGHILRDPTGEQPWKMPAQLFRNLGGGRFEDVSSAAGDYFQEENLGRGLAALDWNRDGRLDMVVVHQDRPAALLENHTPMTDIPMQIRLVGTGSNRDGVGAVVRIDSGQQTATYTCGGDGGFLTEHERHRLFRVPPQADVTLEVRWPSGKVSHETLAAGDVSEVTDSIRVWTVVEANETPGGGHD